MQLRAFWRAVLASALMFLAATLAVAQDIYLLENGAQAGPFGPAELEARAAQGGLTPETLVWMEGMPNWAPAKDVPALAAYLGPPQPGAPGAVQIYLLENGNQTGPHDRQTVQDRVDRGLINAQTYVWVEGMANWDRLGAVAEQLQITVKPKAVPPPPPPPRDWSQFVAGTWDAEPQQAPIEGVGMATFTAVTIFDARGAFTMTGSISAATAYGPMTLQQSAEGTFTVEDAGDGKLKLVVNGTLTVQGPPGSTIVPDIKPIKESNIFEVLDDNTIRDVKSGGVSRRRL